jgi:hypothetical protein
MQTNNEHNFINKIFNVEKNLRTLVYNAIIGLDSSIGDNKILIVGGKCFDIGINKNILEFLNFQHNQNKSNNIPMSQLLQNNDLSKFLTSSDIDVHLIPNTIINQINFTALITSFCSNINRSISNNNLDYFNSVVKIFGLRAVNFGTNNYVKISYPSTRVLEDLRMARMYMEFEFIDNANNVLLHNLETLDPSRDTNIRVINNSKVRIYIFDIVVENPIIDPDSIVNRLTSSLISTNHIKMPGLNNIYLLNAYDVLNQIYKHNHCSLSILWYNSNRRNDYVFC